MLAFQSHPRFSGFFLKYYIILTAYIQAENISRIIKNALDKSPVIKYIMPTAGSRSSSTCWRYMWPVRSGLGDISRRGFFYKTALTLIISAAGTGFIALPSGRKPRRTRLAQNPGAAVEEELNAILKEMEAQYHKQNPVLKYVTEIYETTSIDKAHEKLKSPDWIAIYTLKQNDGSVKFVLAKTA